MTVLHGMQKEQFGSFEKLEAVVDEAQHVHVEMRTDANRTHEKFNREINSSMLAWTTISNAYLACRILRWHAPLYFEGQQTWNPS